MVLTQFLPMDSYYHRILAATELGVDGLVEVVRVDGVVSRGRQIF